jgi:hypothetical protein
MDNLAGPESVDVEAGLGDTIRMLASKAKMKGAAVTLDVKADLRACTRTQPGIGEPDR